MYRRGVAALIMNTKQEILLVNLISFEEKYFAVPGGGQDEDETLQEAAYREIKEELNINKSDLELVGISNTPVIIEYKKNKLIRNGISYEGQERYYFGFRFTGNEKSIHPNDGEVRSFKWVSIKDLSKYLLFENQLEDTLEKVREMFR